MGSASREALAKAKESLTGPIEERAGVELLSAAAEIDATPALRSALADASASGDAKLALVDRLFGAASLGARKVLGASVSQAWSNPGELVDGIEELGLRSLANSNGALADELLQAAAVIDSDNELELGLAGKLGDPAAKVALVERIFSGKLTSSTVSVVAHLAAYPRGRRINSALRESARIAADQGGSELATVTVAAELSADQQARLGGLLEQSAGRPVRLTTVVDPTLLGGMRVQIGDDVIDGSIRTRLDDLRLRLAG